MSANIIKLSLSVTFIFVLTFIISGCSKESDPLLPQTEHLEPEGWILNDSTGSAAMVIWEGVIQTDWNGRRLADTLFCSLNTTSQRYSIRFLDANKNVFDAPDEEDHTFGASVKEENIAGFIQDPLLKWSFRVQGKNTGTTSIELLVYHMGHVDVRTPFIPVTVR